MKIGRPAHWKKPSNSLSAMKDYLEQRLAELVDMPDQEKAVFSAYVFLVAATSPKDYKECVDRFLARMPAGTPYAHELHVIHESISAWVKPRTRYEGSDKRSGIEVRLYLSDTTLQRRDTRRHAYFVQLLQAQGIAHPVPEQVRTYALAWMYAKIDAAIEELAIL